MRACAQFTREAIVQAGEPLLTGIAQVQIGEPAPQADAAIAHPRRLDAAEARQVVAPGELPNYEAVVKHLHTGASVSIDGEVKASPAKGQATELHATRVELVGDADAESYPLQKKGHTYEFLRQIPWTGEFSRIPEIAWAHHERLNGKGYPHGLKGDEISLFAKMGAVCDVYDAITSNRPYKAGWDPAESIQKMAHWAKEGHFDERIFQAFVKSIGIYPIGSLVKLKSGRLAVVMEPGTTSLVCPIVKVFFSTKSNEPIKHALVNLGDPKANDAIVARENPATWGFPNLEALWSKPA